MKSIFLRIYGGMLLTLVLVAALGVLTLHLVNEVRGDRYREELARGTFRLMADEMAGMEEVDRKRALLQWSRLMGIPLSLQKLDALGMDGRDRARLMNNQVLVEADGPHQVRIHTQVSLQEGLVLTGEVEQVSEQLARATIYMLMDELRRFPASEQPYHLARIVRDKRFGFDVHLLRLKEIDLDDDQSRRVEEGDTVLALGKNGDSIRVVAGIVDTPWVLELGPIYQMNPYPPQLLLLIAVGALPRRWRVLARGRPLIVGGRSLVVPRGRALIVAGRRLSGGADRVGQERHRGNGGQDGAGLRAERGEH